MRSLNSLGIEIDYPFLQKLENASGTMAASVPDPKGSNSGVTVCTGFDLGARKWDAVQKLRENPLKMTTTQCVQVDSAVKTHFVSQLRVKYNALIGSDQTKFEDLPAAAQTVMLSVAFQYGLAFRTHKRKFWAACIKQDWNEVVKVLKDPKQRYFPRRLAEALHLEQNL